MVIADLSKQVRWVSTPYSGSTHDFTIFKHVFQHIQLRNHRLHVDAGFSGITSFLSCKFVFIPFKASANRPLTTVQLALNQLLAQERVVVENALARVKAFFVLRIENRMRHKQKLADAFQLCAALANFKHACQLPV